MAGNPDQAGRLETVKSLQALLATAARPVVTRRSTAVAPACAGPLLTSLPLLAAAAEPNPLSVRQLVELLKTPGCVGPGRRVVLDQLGIRHRRGFADLWDFVRFAQAERPDLDLAGPPQRPAGPMAGAGR
jgi:hypothetical protein